MVGQAGTQLDSLSGEDILISDEAIDASDEDEKTAIASGHASHAGASKHASKRASNPTSQTLASKQGTRRADDISYFFEEHKVEVRDPKNADKIKIDLEKVCNLCE